MARATAFGTSLGVHGAALVAVVLVPLLRQELPSQVRSSPMADVWPEIIPVALAAPRPAAYPEIARVAHVRGTIVLDCTIDPAGNVVDVRVLSGSPLLSPAAVDAVRRWRYSPTRLNGVPVSVLLMVTVRFELKR